MVTEMVELAGCSKPLVRLSMRKHKRFTTLSALARTALVRPELLFPE
jgi:hypothetical protein